MCGAGIVVRPDYGCIVLEGLLAPSRGGRLSVSWAAAVSFVTGYREYVACGRWKAGMRWAFRRSQPPYVSSIRGQESDLTPAMQLRVTRQPGWLRTKHARAEVATCPFWRP
jgi:hypothetical protein